MLEIGDALLASPILVLQVDLNCDDSLDTVALLRERFGDHMLIGAGSVLNVDHFDAAMAAGAQYSMAHTLDTRTTERAQAVDFLHIPGVSTFVEARAAHCAGSRMVRLNVDDDKGPQLLLTMRSLLDEVDYVPAGEFSANEIDAYQRAGASAVCIGSSLVSGPDQPMDDLITQARVLRAAWLGLNSP